MGISESEFENNRDIFRDLIQKFEKSDKNERSKIKNVFPKNFRILPDNMFLGYLNTWLSLSEFIGKPDASPNIDRKIKIKSSSNLCLVACIWEQFRFDTKGRRHSSPAIYLDREIPYKSLRKQRKLLQKGQEYKEIFIKSSKKRKVYHKLCENCHRPFIAYRSDTKACAFVACKKALSPSRQNRKKINSSSQKTQ